MPFIFRLRVAELGVFHRLHADPTGQFMCITAPTHLDHQPSSPFSS
jgi:hypothetical protein